MALLASLPLLLVVGAYTGLVYYRDYRISLSVQKGLEIARAISYRAGRTRALASIAAALAEGGRPEQALEVAREVEDLAPYTDGGEMRSWVLAEVAEVLAAAGRTERALEVAQEVDDEQWRSDMLGTIAVTIVRKALGLPPNRE